MAVNEYDSLRGLLITSLSSSVIHLTCCERVRVRCQFVKFPSPISPSLTHPRSNALDRVVFRIELSQRGRGLVGCRVFEISISPVELLLGHANSL